jgi:hypothetical protein
MTRMIIFFFCLGLLKSSGSAAQLNLRVLPDTVGKKIMFPVLPQNFYNNHLGFFCKKEFQVQKALSLPLFFRLGTKEYVDFLEKKPNAVYRRP